MKLQNQGAQLFMKATDGKFYPVVKVCQSDEATNKFLSEHRNCGLIDIDDDGNQYIAEA